MRDPLVGDHFRNEDGGAARGLAARGRRALRLRGGDGGDDLIMMGGCCCFSVATFLVVCSMFVGALDPNSYAIVRNSLTGSVGHDVYRGGLHFPMLPWQSFIEFPATRITVEFSKSLDADRLPVLTRTGADPQDPDSGGQPIQISCAFQMSFVPETLPEVYLSFGSLAAAMGRYVLLSSNMVSNTAQKFTPQDFWKRRDVIADTMLHALNKTVWEHGHSVVKMFEIMNVDFASRFEDSITAVQVAEQQKVVNEYEQVVAEVVQSIEVMKSVNRAKIANISAGADATAKEIAAGATRDAFNLKQTMKANKYNELQKTLSLDARQLTEYFKIKSLQAQGQSGKIVVGLPSVGVGSNKAARATEL